MRQQRHLRFNTKATHSLCRHHSDFRQLLRRRIVVDVSIGDKSVTTWQQQGVHRPSSMHAVTMTKHLFHHAEVLMVVANRTADHRIRFAALYHDCADHRGVGNHRTLRLLLGNPTTLHNLVVLAPVLFKARIGLIVDDFKIDARFDLQTQFLDTHFNNARTTDQDWFCQP